LAGTLSPALEYGCSVVGVGRDKMPLIASSHLTQDEWLSTSFQYPVFRLNADGWFQTFRQDGKILLESFPYPRVFLYTKVSTDELEKVSALEKLGFHVVDTALTFEKAVSKRNSLVGNCALRFAKLADRKSVMEIAEKNFRYSRFHLDPQIDKSLAGRIKSEWAGNYFTGKRGDQMVVATEGERVVGFNQILHGQNGTLVIDLIAVDSVVRRRGVAQDMIAYSENESGAFSKIRVGTQAANVASVRLYEKLGFRLIGSQYVLHYHLPEKES